MDHEIKISTALRHMQTQLFITSVTDQQWGSYLDQAPNKGPELLVLFIFVVKKIL